MSFPLGKPILVMLVLALAGGVAIALRPEAPPADLTVWVFDETHARVLREPPGPGELSLIEQYRRRTGRSVRVDLISSRALDTRLVSLFMSGRSDGPLPDLAEVEIGSVGMFLRPPVDEVGFLPLNGLLEESGWAQRIIRSRFAPWSKEGTIFGVPHDVHPVTITYRRDLFEQAGVDLAQARTWNQFQQACLRFQAYWRQPGQARRWAMQLPASSGDYLTVMLLQRGINVVDDRGRVHLAEPKVAHTVAFYAQLVAGRDKVAADPTPGGVLWARDLAQGEICAAFTPDWAAAYLRGLGADLSGKLAMMPLPRFDPSDAPTATWGGTKIGIPRRCRDPRRSWELLEFLYLSPEAMRARRRFTDILPPVIEEWNNPAYHQPDALFGGQKVQELYVELAGRIPPRYVTPYSTLGTQALSAVLSKAVRRVEDQGSEGLEQDCQRWLDEAAAYLERVIRFGDGEIAP